MPHHRLTPPEPVEVSRTGRHCEPDQTLFARGAYTESDKPLREKAVWPRETRTGTGTWMWDEDWDKDQFISELP